MRANPKETDESIVPPVSIPPFLGLPRGVSHRRVRARDVELAALTTEAEPGHERALLVPGFTGSKEDFIAVLPLLQQAGVHAVAYDQLGQYESSTDADEQRFALEQLAADAVALSEVVWPEGPRPHLVGHSLGGLVARAAALAAPGAFRSVTLLASGPAAVPEHQRAKLRGLHAALPQVDLVQVWEVKQAMEANLGIEPPPADILEFLRRRWIASSPAGFRAKAAILLEEVDRVGQLRSTGLPVCVTTGTADDVWSPEQQAEMAMRLEGYHVRIQDAGHSPAADAPAATAAALLGFWGGPVRAAQVKDDAQRNSPRSRLLTEPVAATNSRQARAFADTQLTAWGLEQISDSVQLIASELVTNALRHGGGTADISLSYRPGVVRVEVRDSGSGEPRLLEVPPDAESGRGLAIVAQLSAAWGVEYHDDGKTVWADVSIPSDAAAG